MHFEIIFSLVGIAAMIGWLALLLSPIIPEWSDRLAGWIIPAALASAYVGIALTPNDVDGGYASFAEVAQLFTNESAVMSGWIHFLAFDLVIGAWICRTARKIGIRFWLVLPTLPLTFLYGPAGFLVFAVMVAATVLMKGGQTSEVQPAP